MKSHVLKLSLRLVLAFLIISSVTARVSYADSVGQKLKRGLSNTVFGIVEFPKGVKEVASKENFLLAATWGPIYGAGNSLVRISAGLYEVLTFVVPIPQGYKPILQPESVF